MAGRVGCGGGPGAPVPLFPPPAGSPEPQVLEKGEGDQRHQRVPMQARPGAALEVVEAELLLELLVRLLEHPARLDQRRQDLERRVRRKVGEVVLRLARGTALAGQPDLLAG